MALDGLRDHLNHLATAVGVVPGEQLTELRVLLAELGRLLRGQVRLVQDAHSPRILLLLNGLRVAGLGEDRRPVCESCAITININNDKLSNENNANLAESRGQPSMCNGNTQIITD